MLKIISLVLLASFCFAENLLEFVGHGGYIDWSNGKIYAIGYGIPNPKQPKNMAMFGARRAAIVDAKRNLLETVGGVKITTETIIENEMLKNDKIKSVVSGVVKNASVISLKEENGLLKALVQAPIAGSIMDVVYPDSIKDDISALLERIDIKYNLREYPILASSNEKAIEGILDRLNRLEKAVFYDDKLNKKKITGVIIDARGTNFIPTLSPKIYKVKSSSAMYPDGVVDRDTIVNHLAALFVADLDDAKKHPRVGDYPVIFKALRTYGKWRDKLILGKNDSKKFVDLLNTEALRNGNVVIIVSR
jgi:hypothetical protein